MKSNVSVKSIVKFYFFSIITLGIYGLVTWSKVSKEVEILCEGDGKKTMKHFPAWILTLITAGIFGIIWKAKLAERLCENAERYELKFSESGKLVGLFSVLCYPLAHFILLKNFNKMVIAFNEYNGIEVEDESDLFKDTEEDDDDYEDEETETVEAVEAEEVTEEAAEETTAE